MELLRAIISFIASNADALAIAGLAVIAAGEAIVALTPTKSDDIFLERVATKYRRFVEMLGLPNRKAGGGVHPTLAEKEKVDQTKAA
jgi:hypothetical protein